ncbi:MAG: right-handed parallel beta-helix repeat-containing protein, partial [Anaerolineales bacterium]|nr:right-handed parallel beta-helix repeat-containing protein [Anaerolineales bacterium]
MKHNYLTFVALCLAGWLALTTNTAVQAATFTVTNTNDSGAGSLRNQIAAAAANPGPDTINFAASLSGQTIALTSGELSINHDVTIDGSALAERLTIDGQNNTGRILYIVDGTVTIDSLRFINGDSNDGDPGDDDGDGGAIHIAYATSVTIQNSEFSGNQSQYNGGALYILQSPITLTNNTFTNNSTQHAGGAIRNADGAFAVNITNNTFVGNWADTGAAIWLSGGAEVIANNTFSNNRDVLAVYNNAPTPLQLNNNTFLGTDGVFARSAGAVLHMRNNIIGDCQLNGGSIGTNTNNWIVNGSCSPAYSGNPQLGPLADNGGPTQTAAPLPGSGVLDAGDNATCTTNDQRGMPRRDGNGDSVVTCDLGAYEGGTMQCGVGAGNSYPFPNQSGVSILVNSEVNLDCLYVDEIPVSHPNATGVSEGQDLRTGKYWLIGGLQTDKTSTATFNVDLTLPYASASASTRACKWLDGAGPGFGWNCEDGAMGTTFDLGTSVTRQGVTAFSQWAVGDGVGPTAVTNLQADTTPRTGQGWLVGLLVGLMGA